MLSPVSPGNETAWILTRPPVYLADLLSRRFRGVLRYGLERPVIIRIWNDLDGFRLIRLTFYIRES